MPIKLGDPFLVPGKNPPNVLYGLSSGSAVDLVRDRAVEEANADKALGTRILAIGVGNAFGGGSSGAAARGRLVAVSGPQVVTDATDITSLNEVDVALVDSSTSCRTSCARSSPSSAPRR